MVGQKESDEHALYSSPWQPQASMATVADTEYNCSAHNITVINILDVPPVNGRVATQ